MKSGFIEKFKRLLRSWTVFWNQDPPTPSILSPDINMRFVAMEITRKHCIALLADFLLMPSLVLVFRPFGPEQTTAGESVAAPKLP